MAAAVCNEPMLSPHASGDICTGMRAPPVLFVHFRQCSKSGFGINPIDIVFRYFAVNFARETSGESNMVRSVLLGWEAATDELERILDILRK